MALGRITLDIVTFFGFWGAPKVLGVTLCTGRGFLPAASVSRLRHLQTGQNSMDTKHTHERPLKFPSEVVRATG